MVLWGTQNWTPKEPKKSTCTLVGESPSASLQYNFLSCHNFNRNEALDFKFGMQVNNKIYDAKSKG